MIDIVKENYSRMGDEELIRLSKTDGKELSTEATSALYQEFLKRKLDITIFASLRAHRIAQYKKEIENINAAKAQESTASIWTYCFEAKREGKTDEEIFNGLLESGLDEQQCAMVVNSIEDHAIAIEKRYDNDQLIGFFTCVIGIVVTVATYSSGGTYIIAWGAILFGAIRFVGALSNKNRFRKILKNIQEQKQETIETEDVSTIRNHSII